MAAGRPRLGVKGFNIRLSTMSVEEIRARWPNVNLTDFVRNAVDEKLEREKNVPSERPYPDERKG